MAVDPLIPPEHTATLHELLSQARLIYGATAIERIANALGGAPELKSPTLATDPLQRPEFIFPGLTAKSWHDPSDYLFTSRLEAATEDIARELEEALKRRDCFQPYRQDRDEFIPEGAWKALYFRVADSWIEENRPYCPKTFAVLEKIPRLAEIAMFSALNPGGHIRPHCGTWNCRITFHLGLVIPEGDCGIRVGHEKRTWTRGKCLAFDDSFEHESWNHGSRTRFVLLFDIWHPDLTEAEVWLIENLRRRAKLHDGASMMDRIRTDRQEDQGRVWWR